MCEDTMREGKQARRTDETEDYCVLQCDSKYRDERMVISEQLHTYLNPDVLPQPMHISTKLHPNIWGPQ